MKHSTTTISPPKVNNLAGKALVKSPRLRESQQKVEEVCQMYFMKLRSGHIIENRDCYFRKKNIKRHPPKTARKYDKQHLVFTPCQQRLDESSENIAFDVQQRSENIAFDVQQRSENIAFDVQQRSENIAFDVQQRNRRNASEDSFSLSTYNDQFVTFAFADGSYEIYVEDLGKKQEKDKVLFRYHDSQSPISPRGDVVDGERLMVSLSPSKDKDFLLHANNQEHSVELQKCENPLPDQTFFFLHKEPGPSSCVSFECKSNPGVFIGVEDNHLALIQLKDQTEHSRRENIKFKLS